MEPYKKYQHLIVAALVFVLFILIAIFKVDAFPAIFIFIVLYNILKVVVGYNRTLSFKENIENWIENRSIIKKRKRADKFIHTSQ
jgi:uncharacterized membrane protein